jgi:ubiquinone/menaquinone biosynthesis C-methylase UbiE
MLSSLYHKIRYRLLNYSERNFTNTEYWSKHNVTAHRAFATREASLDYLDWRNAQYLFYEKLMPTNDMDGKAVLDYGCGPGNDLVGFWEHSKPSRLIGIDISSQALAEARRRLSLHAPDQAVELLTVDDGSATLPLDDGSVDLIHSSGVLHHTPNLDALLAEFRRVLRPGGRARIMIYNYDSLWLHLYVAYVRRIERRIDTGLPLKEAFKRSTDGKNCPLSGCFKPEEFLAICRDAGFSAEFKGAAVSLIELSMLHKRFQAIQHMALPQEHRHFLSELTFDSHGLPCHNGAIAGIDAVFELSK